MPLIDPAVEASVAVTPRRLAPKIAVAALTAALLAAMTLVLWPASRSAPDVGRAASPSQDAAVPVPAPLPERDWAAIDQRVSELLATARLQQAMQLQSRLVALSGTLRTRVDRTFVPWYLSFGRRKLEELGAYNLYARDRLMEWAGGGRQDSAQIKLITTFETEFAAQVLRPDETRRALRHIGQDVADGYASRVAVGLREIQNQAGVSFAAWQTYLSRQPPLAFIDGDGRRHAVPLAALATPDPTWVEIGTAIGEAAAARFDHMPSIVDLTVMVDSKGRSIFAAGENAALYFGSYLVYWAGLIILLRSGIIPFNIFGFLLGWLAWETFVWGSWIGVEYLDFERTRAALSPVIEARVDSYLGYFEAMIGDPGPNGPLQILHQMERR